MQTYYIPAILSILFVNFFSRLVKNLVSIRAENNIRIFIPSAPSVHALPPGVCSSPEYFPDTVITEDKRRGNEVFV